MKDKIVEILKLYEDPAEDLNHNLYDTIAEEIDALYSAGEEVWAWVKPEDELPPTHHIVIGIDNDGTTVAYLWWNKEDNIWRYGFEGDGNVHAPEPEFWLKQITRQPVSEERIKEMGEDFKEKFGLEAGAAFISGAQWAIKELNR